LTVELHLKVSVTLYLLLLLILDVTWINLSKYMYDYVIKQILHGLLCSSLEYLPLGGGNQLV